MGDEIFGSATSQECTARQVTLTSIEYNLCQTVSISENETDTGSTTAVENSISTATSGTSFDNDTTSLYPAETNTGDLVGPPVLAVTATETDTSSDSTTFTANDITGLEYTSSQAVDSITRPETISLASSDTTGGKFTLTTTDSTENTNSITGGFSLSELSHGSLSNFETDTDGGLTNSNTETGTTSASSQESGNNITGSFSLSETSYSTTTVVESDAVGAVHTSATTTGFDFTSASSAGNDVTGAETTSGLDQSSATLAKTDSYGSGDLDDVTITTSGADLTSGSDNTITGSFSLSDSSSSTVTTYDSGSRFGNNYSVAASTDIGTVTSSEAGNEITGASTATQTASDSTALNETGDNTSGIPYTLAQQDHSTVTTFSSDNSITGTALQTAYAAETTSIGQEYETSGGGSGTAVNLSFSELTFSGGTAVENANTITGVYGSTTNELDTSTFSETGSNAAGNVAVSSTTSESPRITESGNTIAGDYTFSETGTQDYTTSESDSYSGSGTGGPESWSFLETGSKGFSLTQSGSHVTGAYTLSEQGTDNYTISELGGGGTGGTSGGGGGSSGGGGGGGSTSGTAWGLTLWGTDNYTTNELGNELSGAFYRSTGGSGGADLAEGGALASLPYDSTPATAFVVNETGNYLSGALSFYEAGTDRYSLIEGFTNVSNVIPSNGPGAIDFTPVGAPYHVGASPYWGHGPAANLDANAADAAFNELGLELLHKYCWRHTTYVFVADNAQHPRNAVLKLMREVIPGDLVLCPSDKDPHGTARWKKVLRTFKNKPAAIWEIVTDRGNAVHPTANHPIYVVEQGWKVVAALGTGDPLLSRDGKPLRVASVTETGLVEEVYNLLVDGHHTYFVSDGDDTFSLLAHNISDEDLAAQNDAKGERSTRRSSTAGENAYAAEGRVAGAAIEDHDKTTQGSKTQAKVTRKGEQPGRQDIGKGGSRTTGAEIGPGSRTGVEAKGRQNESLKKPGNVILFRQRGKPQPTGGSEEYVELTRKQMDQLRTEIKNNPKWTSEEIFAKAKEMAGGVSKFAPVKEQHAAYAGEQYLRGKKVRAAGRAMSVLNAADLLFQLRKEGATVEGRENLGPAAPSDMPSGHYFTDENGRRFVLGQQDKNIPWLWNKAVGNPTHFKIFVDENGKPIEGEAMEPLEDKEFDKLVEEGEQRWGKWTYDPIENKYKFTEGTEQKLEDVPVFGPNGGLMRRSGLEYIETW